MKHIDKTFIHFANKNKLVWAYEFCFDYCEGNFRTCWYSYATEYEKIRWGAWGKESMDVSYFKELRIQRKHEDVKYLHTTYFCPYGKCYWFVKPDNKIIQKFTILNHRFGTTENAQGKFCDMAHYLELLALWESLPEIPVFQIKSNPLEKNKSREEKRKAMISLPWHIESHYMHQEDSDALYKQTYGAPDITFKTIQKAIVRKQRRIAKQRELSKREQNFFALMAGASNMNQLKKLIK